MPNRKKFPAPLAEAVTQHTIRVPTQLAAAQIDQPKLLHNLLRDLCELCAQGQSLHDIHAAPAAYIAFDALPASALWPMKPDDAQMRHRPRNRGLDPQSLPANSRFVKTLAMALLLSVGFAGAKAQQPGRFQLVCGVVSVAGDSLPRLFRLDTVTGETQELLSANIPVRGDDGKMTAVTARGWSPIPENFWEEFERLKGRFASPPPILTKPSGSLLKDIQREQAGAKK